jgi:hypothetical protein
MMIQPGNNTPPGDKEASPQTGDTPPPAVRQGGPKTFVEKIKERWQKLPRQITEKRLSYWFNALLVLIVCSLSEPAIYEYFNLGQARAWVFQKLGELNPRPLQPRFVKVVLIGDDEFWRGYPAGRRPIKRDYLAQLVDKLVQANAHVIALDFDFQLPDPEHAAIPSDYKPEVDILIRSVINAAELGKKVILPRTLRDTDKGNYVEPDIQQPYGICISQDKDGNWKNIGAPEFAISDNAKRNITCGHILLPDDIARVSGQVQLKDGSYLDSFSLTVARAADPELAKHIESRPTFASQISHQAFREHKRILSAGELFSKSADELRQQFDCQTVILGGGWSLYAYNEGDPVDLHATALGASVGANIHANFVEAFLDSRTFVGSPERFVTVLELSFGVFAIIVFALCEDPLRQLAAIVGLTLLLVAIQWLALHQLGIFVDAFIALLGVWLHSLYERGLWWHSIYQRYFSRLPRRGTGVSS